MGGRDRACESVLSVEKMKSSECILPMSLVSQGGYDEQLDKEHGNGPKSEVSYDAGREEE